MKARTALAITLASIAFVGYFENPAHADDSMPFRAGLSLVQLKKCKPVRDYLGETAVVQYEADLRTLIAFDTTAASDGARAALDAIEVLGLKRACASSLEGLRQGDAAKELLK